MTDKKVKVICVVGPTASGKTALSVEIAKKYDGEIISCDSMQIYKGMDIGTAKVTEEEKQGIKHHLTDVKEPDENFSVSDYTEMATAAVDDITSRGKIPVFCGGTGLYLDNLLSGNTLPEGTKDEKLRSLLMQKTPDELYKELLGIDPESAKSTHKNNVKRVIRAIEIYRTTGVTKTEWDRRSKETPSRFMPVMIGLDYKSREILYERINRRVDIMFEKGLIDEVKKLDSPDFRKSTASQAIGYKEVLMYLDGRISLNEAKEMIKQGSRNYAKRQLTWFKRNVGIKWIYPDEAPGNEDNFKFIVNSAINIINRF